MRARVPVPVRDEGCTVTGGRRSRDKPPFLAKYAGKILITVVPSPHGTMRRIPVRNGPCRCQVVSAVLLCDMRGLTTPVDRFKSRHHMQTLTDAGQLPFLHFGIQSDARN